MKKRVLFVISFSFGIFIIAAMFWHFGIGDVLHLLYTFPPVDFVIAIIFTFLVNYLYAKILQIFLIGNGYDISIWALIKLETAAFAIRRITPAASLGSEPATAYILIKNYKTHPLKTISTIMTSRGLEFSSFLVVIYIGLFFGIRSLSLAPGWKTSLLSGSLMIGVLLAAVAIHFLTRFKWISKLLGYLGRFNRLKFLNTNALPWLDKLEAEFKLTISQKRNVLLPALGLSFGLVFTMMFQMKFILHSLGYSLPMETTFFVFAAFMVAYLCPFTPAGAGTLEATQIFIFSLFDIGPSVALTYALIARAVEFIFTLVGLIFLSHYGINIGKEISMPTTQCLNYEEGNS